MTGLRNRVNTPIVKPRKRLPGRKRVFLARAKAEFAARPEKQRLARLSKNARKAAYAARAAYKPRKADRGQLIFIDTTGRRDPSKKGRKGYAIYVTKTGKKWLLKEKRAKEPFRARTRSKLNLPAGSRLKAAKEKFERRRLVTVHRQAIVKGSGSATAGGAHDFSERVSDKIASSVKRVIGSQASHRIFQIEFNALVKLPSGQIEAISGQVPIEYPDHVAISVIGVRAWARHKFYSFLARELAFAGYVSNGSANHIRRLSDNSGKPRNQWKDKRGEPWSGRDKEQVEILKIEWKIEQAK